MKNIYTLFYDPLEVSSVQISDILRKISNLDEMKDRSIVALPYEVSLRKLDKDELKALLKIYTKITKVLLNE